MKYIEAPDPYDGSGKSIFLAGGITACIDWQAKMTERLSQSALTLLNPAG